MSAVAEFALLATLVEIINDLIPTRAPAILANKNPTILEARGVARRKTLANLIGDRVE